MSGACEQKPKCLALKIQSNLNIFIHLWLNKLYNSERQNDWVVPSAHKI